MQVDYAKATLIAIVVVGVLVLIQSPLVPFEIPLGVSENVVGQSAVPGRVPPPDTFTINPESVLIGNSVLSWMSVMSTNDVTYRYGYYWIGGEWRRINLEGYLVGQDWVVGEANGHFVITSAIDPTLDTGYVAIYSCSREDGAWDCPDDWELHQFAIDRSCDVDECIAHSSCHADGDVHPGDSGLTCEQGNWVDNGQGDDPDDPDDPVPLSELGVQVTGISKDDNNYRVHFVTENFVNQLNGPHVQFYFDTEDITVTNKVYAGSTPYLIPLNDFDMDATSLCGTVADGDGTIIDDRKFSCFDLSGVEDITGDGLFTEIFGVTDLDGTVLVTERLDATIDFDWSGSYPIDTFSSEQYAVRWTGYIEVPATGGWTFTTRSDDGVVVFLDGDAIINDWEVHAEKETNSASITLTGGEKYPLTVEYFNQGDTASIELLWSGPGVVRSPIPAQYLHRTK